MNGDLRTANGTMWGSVLVLVVGVGRVLVNCERNEASYRGKGLW